MGSNRTAKVSVLGIGAFARVCVQMLSIGIGATLIPPSIFCTRRRPPVQDVRGNLPDRALS